MWCEFEPTLVPPSLNESTENCLQGQLDITMCEEIILAKWRKLSRGVGVAGGGRNRARAVFTG